MARKLTNAIWAEYIYKFNESCGEIIVKDFYIQNELTQNQFYYHKRFLVNRT